MDKGNMPPPPPPGFAPPPPSGFVPPPPPPPYSAPQPNVYVVGSMQFGPDSQRLKCPHCQADISTVVETEANMKTHLFALLLCIIGFWCCAPCPYCMDSCLTKKHYCPSCNTYLGQTTD